MALTNCPECGKEISMHSEKCIYCGYPMKGELQKSKIKTVIIIAIIVIVTVIAVCGLVLWMFLGKAGNVKNVCKVENCDESVYTNGYCFEHYGKVRLGEEISQKPDVDSTGFEEDKDECTLFERNSKVITESTDFTLTGYSISRRIDPPDCNESYYHYFEASPDNVFVDVKLLVKNKSSIKVDQDNVFKSVTLIYDNTYEYQCSFVTINSKGDFNQFTSLYGINPLETMNYHMLAEVPNEVKNSGKSLKCQVRINNDIFECTLR